MCFRRTTVVGPSDQVIDEEIRSLVLVSSVRRFLYVRADAIGTSSGICRSCSRNRRTGESVERRDRGRRDHSAY